MRELPGSCWIGERALGDLLIEARAWPRRETGGALLGWREGEDAVVARVLGPGPLARHGYRSFEPDGEWQQREGERLYRESGRRVAYLGDWHTHPLGSPKPSPQDLKTVAAIAADDAFRAPEPLYAIAAKPWYRGGAGRWQLRMMQWRDGRLGRLQVRKLPEATVAAALR